MSNIVKFEELSKRIKEQDTEDYTNLLLTAMVLQALTDITQEINAVLHVCGQSDLIGDKMKKAIQQYADTVGTNNLFAVSDLFAIHGESLANFSKAISQAVKTPPSTIDFEYAKAEEKETIAKDFLQSHTPIIKSYMQAALDELRQG